MKTIRGFTLIELILVIVLTAILGSVGALILQQNYKAYFTAKNINSLVYNSNIAVFNLMREIKSAQSISAIGATGLSFVNQKGQPIVIDLNGTTLRRNVIASSGLTGLGPQTLCPQVSSVAFAYFDRTFAATAVPSNVSFITMNILTSTGNVTPSLMTGTVLRGTLP